jgi:hypothetical protein
LANSDDLQHVVVEPFAISNFSARSPGINLSHAPLVGKGPAQLR